MGLSDGRRSTCGENFCGLCGHDIGRQSRTNNTKADAGSWLTLSWMDRGHADRRISWNDWGKDVTTIHIPGIASVRIVDLKLLALRGSLFYPEPWSVEVYDLSKSANKGIRVQGVSEEQEGRYGTVPPTPKPFGTCQGEGEILLRTFAMGNKVVCIYVSPPVRLRPVVLDSTSYYAEFVFTL